ncbi:tetratricopeptide repeat protein 36 [Plutella xylostella]|uniref:tetratricopeptide repeat protein 36 n=1 Tax=Plutella xylostella TaxID=51655 RepID=UPI0020324CB0|nr:tetratricopeptide repeat protein 36 [Plutella xylostella]
MEGLSDRDQAVLRSIMDPTATLGDLTDDSDNFPEDNAPTSDSDRLSAELCARGAALAEGGRLGEALALMGEGVAAAPARPDAYNDRAQVLRLMMRDTEALSDIERALSLTAGSRCRARALALCQRGLLRRKAGAEADARADFVEAADLGSAFAKKQAVELNPYAALCNQMLSQVLRGDKEIKL